MTIGDLIEFQRGYDLPKSDFIEGNIPVISSNGILGYHNEYKVKGPGITIGRSGTVGLPQYIENNFFPHNTALFVKDFKGNNPKYIYYLLKTLGLNDRKSGSGVPTMNRNHLHPLSILAHTNIIHQQKIASVLSSLDSKIELNNRINAELETMAKTLYDYWFVQFDFPDKKGKPYKSSGGKMVWNEELKREIPDGWGLKRLGDYCEVIRGVTYNKNEIKNEFDKDVIPILRATNITGNQIDLSDMVYVPKSNLSNNQILKKFDILMTMSSGSKLHVGKNAFYCYDQELSYGAFCSKIAINIGMKCYVYQVLQSVKFKKYLSNVCLGTNINNLTNEHINGFKLLIPSDNQLMVFEKAVEGYYNQISCHLIQNQKLSELRDWLLPMLMNGQVRVTEVAEVE